MVTRKQIPRTKSINLKKLFLSLQNQLNAKLQTNRESLGHPGTKGEASELNWSGMLMAYLPQRYSVSKAFVVDSQGVISDQIDIVIHDQQYSPFLFNQDGARYIPAESVYAVFEVKQELNASVMKYAKEKAASVRRLKRTSVAIAHAGGTFAARKPFPILAGILCLESAWSPLFGAPFVKSLQNSSPQEQLNLGCIVEHGAFHAKYEGRSGLSLAKSASPDTALIFFFLRFLQNLQRYGTAPALDLQAYGKML